MNREWLWFVFEVLVAASGNLYDAGIKDFPRRNGQIVYEGELFC